MTAIKAFIKPQRGFTLLEVLLAMAISATVAVLAYSQLSVAISASEVHQVKAKQLADIQLVLNVMERDIRNVINRPISDEFDEIEGPLFGGELQDALLTFTRGAWDNPQDLPRGELQRVRYRYENRELWRENWSTLDRDNLEDGFAKVLMLSDVADARVSFMKVETPANPVGAKPVSSWVDSWEKAKEDLPYAVKIELEIDGFGRLSRIYEIIAN